MWRYYELLSDKDLNEIQALRSQVEGGSLHPMEVKKSLAAELVARFHGRSARRTARNYFETTISEESYAERNPTNSFAAPEPIWICRLMVDVLKFAKSTSEARRLIAQGAVKVDGEVINDVNFQFQHPAHNILEVGKNRIAQADKNS